MTFKKVVPMSVEDFQSVLQQMVDETEIEANAVIGVYNIHKQTMLIVPYWECDYAEKLPIKLAHHLATFADVSGTGESIGAFAIADPIPSFNMDEDALAGIRKDAKRATELAFNGDKELEAKH